jgi:hypothetical protein
MSTGRFAMNQPPLPSDVTDNIEVERIKARIRQKRFVWFDQGRLIMWGMLLGAVCGVVGGAWWWCALYLQWYPNLTGPFPQTGVEGGATVILALFGGILFGGQCGFGLLVLTLGFIKVFHPAYIELFYSPEEVKRPERWKPPRIR